MGVGKNDLLLNGGAIIPVPEPISEGANQRVSQAIFWGEVILDPKPFVENTKKRGRLVKINLIIRFGKKMFQKIGVPQDNPFYFAARALQKHDRVLITGLYTEADGWVRDKETGEIAPRIDEKTGEQMVYRDMSLGFLVSEIAMTDPDEWKRRLRSVPDPFYEAEQILEEREARAGTNDPADYTNEAKDLGQNREW